MKYSLPTTSLGHFFEQHLKQRQPGLSIEASRFTIIPPTPNQLNNRYTVWVIDYSYTNCGICRIGRPGKPWLQRPPGVLHLYAPNTRFCEQLPEEGIQSAHITFFGGEAVELTRLIHSNLGFGRFLDPDGSVGLWLVEAAIDASARGENAYWNVMAKLLQIVDRLHASIPEPTGVERRIIDPSQVTGLSRESAFAESVRKFLQQNMDRNVSIEALARHTNSSKSTLAHKYRKLTGETPMQTLAALRVNTVKNLMSKGFSLKLIAAQTGFYDEFHLSKVFKKLTGSPPSLYLGRQSGTSPD